MAQCSYCGQTISSNAVTCPKCGETDPVPRWVDTSSANPSLLKRITSAYDTFGSSWRWGLEKFEYRARWPLRGIAGLLGIALGYSLVGIGAALVIGAVTAFVLPPTVIGILKLIPDVGAFVGRVLLWTFVIVVIISTIALLASLWSVK